MKYAGIARENGKWQFYMVSNLVKVRISAYFTQIRRRVTKNFQGQFISRVFHDFNLINSLALRLNFRDFEGSGRCHIALGFDPTAGHSAMLPIGITYIGGQSRAIGG